MELNIAVLSFKYLFIKAGLTLTSQQGDVKKNVTSSTDSLRPENICLVAKHGGVFFSLWSLVLSFYCSM